MTTTFTTHFRFGLPDFLSSPWQADWYTLVQLMDQVLYETALGTIIDVWANSTVYAVGNLRIDPNLGTIWTCLVAHTSAASPTTFATDRTNHPTFWGAFTVVDGDKGYITVSGSNSVYTINDDVVSNAKLSNMGQSTFKMRAAGAGTGDPIDGTAAQAKTALAIALADIVSGFGTGVAAWLAAPTSANLATAVGAANFTTGSGALVFGTSPILTTPAIITKISPSTDDGAPLGDTTHNFSDLFLASGAVINWNASDITLTHSANLLAFAGASSGYTFDAAVKPSANDAGALGASGTAWADVFLASGGVVNWNAADVTITHGSHLLTFAGGSNGYVFDGALKPNVNNGPGLGVSGTAWSAIFLGSGAIIDFNAGNVVMTHSAGALSIAATTLSTTGAVVAQSGTAVPAGGTAGVGVRMSNNANLGIFFGSGAPTLSAAHGSLYIRTDGSTTATRLYVNTNDSTGWTNVTTAT